VYTESCTFGRQSCNTCIQNPTHLAGNPATRVYRIPHIRQAIPQHVCTQNPTHLAGGPATRVYNIPAHLAGSPARHPRHFKHTPALPAFGLSRHYSNNTNIVLLPTVQQRQPRKHKHPPQQPHQNPRTSADRGSLSKTLEQIPPPAVSVKPYIKHCPQQSQ
jgi:hypothetical protein